MKRFLLLSILTLTLGLFAQGANAQSLKVSGQVTYAEDGHPVIGATVLVEGTSIVAVSDVNGLYEITVPSSSSKMLRVSYAGLLSQTKPVVKNGEVINFIMENDALSIENVIVTGYGSARKVGTVVGSVQQVGSKELENRPSSNVMDALQGKVAGLQIYTSSGEPGQQQSIRLHGVGSLTAASAPLYILDGIQVSQSTIQSMNPNDFESITVLKDASATSIYGSRAANGVIVYTTKRGIRGDAKITVNGYYGTSTQASTKFYDNFMRSDEIIDFWGGLGWYGGSTPEEIATITAAVKKDWVDNGSVDTDWFRYATRQWAPVYSGDIAISGGNEKTNYYISGNVYSQEGNAYGSYYDKMSFRANVNSEVKPWMIMGANVMLSYDDTRDNQNFGSNHVGGGIIYVNDPTVPTFYYTDNDGNQISYQDYIANGGHKVDYWDTPIPGSVLDIYNPQYTVSMQDRSTKEYSTASSAYITLEPIDNLKITSRGGLEFIYSHYQNLWSPDYADRPGNGSNYQKANQLLTGTITNTIEYGFDFADDHNLTFLAGQEGVSYRQNGFDAYVGGIENSALTHLQFGSQSTFDVSSSNAAFSTLSFFGRVDYSFKDFLYVDASIRNDQTSRFSKENRSGVFWAVGAMFNLRNAFMPDNTTITNLSAKLSYGTQGNQDINSYYPYQGTVGAVAQYDGTIGMGVITPANQDLTWETQTKFTAAVNLSLWNKLNIDIEYYLRNTHDMLMNVPLPHTTGFGSVLKNVGGLRNAGVDVAINYDIFRTSDYWMNVGVNFNYNKQTITELFDGREHWTIANTGLAYVVGQAVSYYYPIYAGVNPITGRQEWYEVGEDFTQTTMGETTTTFNKDALIQNTGKKLYAPIAGGFSVGGGWKGISVQADFNFAVGKWLFNNDSYFTDNPRGFMGSNAHKDVNDYWKETGDLAEYPNWNGLVYDPETNSYNNTGDPIRQQDTGMLENASFLRLKNLTVAYNFPRKWFDKQNVFSGFRVYATGRNLFTVTEFTGIDPEVDRNLSIGAYVNTKQFIVGLELTF